MRRRKNNLDGAGMTLVEVMLASAILGVTLVVLLSGASRCLLVMKTSKQYQEAQWALGVGMLERPLFVTNEVDDLEVPDVDYDGFTFSREVGDDDDEDGLYVVKTKVSWGGRGDNRMSEEIVEYVFSPEEEKK